MTISPKHLLWLGNVLLFGLAVWSGVGLAMSWYGRLWEGRIQEGTPVETAGKDRPRARSLAQYEVIAQSRIFGTSPAAETSGPRPPETTPAPVSDGDLRLRGIIVGGPGGYSAAIIEDAKTREQNLYQPGDHLGSMELVRLEKEAAFLRQAGREIRLALVLEEVVETGPGARKDLPWGGAKTPAPGQGPRAAEEPIARPVGPNQYVISRDTISRQMTDLNYFLASVNIQPNFKDGQPHGFRVASLRAGSPIYQLGLRPGDVIVSVNEVTVANPEDVMNLYRQFQQLETVSVVLERQGKPVTLNYSLK
ncbi:MAG: type II secretion system protein N [Thermodesulfobacteriota bacterium]